MLLAVSSCRCGESIVFLFITHYSLFITHLHNDFSRLWSMNGYNIRKQDIIELRSRETLSVLYTESA